MANNNQQKPVIELVEKIHQFLTHQLESNGELSDAAKESLTVANECIEQAYMIQKKPASSELLDIYVASKRQQSSNQQQTGSQTGFMGADPAAFIQNLASTILTQTTGGAASNQQQTGGQAAHMGADPASFIQNLASSILTQATAGAASAGSNSNNNTSASETSSATTASTTNTAPPRVRKRATEAEKLAAESFKNQGNDSMKQDKYKEAYDHYTQAIQIDDNNAIYYSNRAAASSKLGDHHAALRDCQEAVEIDPTYSKAYGRMGLAYASLEDHRKAKDAYVKAVELDPSNESYRTNLRIAEEKLSEASTNTNSGGGANNIMGVLRSMMSNPEVMQMAMRSLQDPRLQSLFMGGAGAGAGAGPGTGGGGGGGAQV